MDADEDVLFAGDVTFDEGEVLFAVEGGPVEVEVEEAVGGGEFDGLDFFDELFAAASVGDERGDGADLELMFFGEPGEAGEAHHRAFVGHDFADGTDGAATGESGKVDPGFSMAGALENSTGFGSQGKDVAGLNEVGGECRGVGHELDGLGAVGGADPGGDVFGGVDTHLEVGAEGFPVIPNHGGDAELLEAFAGGGDADEAASVAGHKID
ncbi:MAG: cyclohydrolase/3,4-dihydroxy-2-butanone 4-phosphate synthase bi-functional protein [Verrucomicrobiota bacterium]